MRHLIQFIVVLVSLLLIVSNANAQDFSKFWIPKDTISYPDHLVTDNERKIISKTIMSNGWVKIERLIQIWNDSLWVNSGNVCYTYDLDGNRIESLYKSWDGDEWVMICPQFMYHV